jgi:hypothetical protein
MCSTHRVGSSESLKRSVASMKLTSGVSSFAEVRSLISFGGVFPVLRSRGHLSCAYLGQYTIKCSTVSLGCPHAGHLGSSTLLNRKIGMTTGNPWVTLGLPVPVPAAHGYGFQRVRVRVPAGLPGRTTGMVRAGGFVKPYGFL